MISQFFILSPRGDTIINKDFRGDGFPNMQEEFFRKVFFSYCHPGMEMKWIMNELFLKVKFWDRSDAPPIIQIEGMTYIYIRRSSLLIVCSTR